MLGWTNITNEKSSVSEHLFVTKHSINLDTTTALHRESNARLDY